MLRTAARFRLPNASLNTACRQLTPTLERPVPWLQLRSNRLQPLQQRLYSTPQLQEEKVRERAAIGPFTLKALGLFTLTGVVLLYYFQNEKERVKKKREEQNAQTTRSIGKPRIGGPFELVDSRDGKTVTDKDFLGRYTLVYFGFTHCPDICPEELDKMSEVVNLMNNDPSLPQPVITPIFISCDPRRDTPPVVRAYVRDFHPALVGLTGTQDAVARAAKQYRVYISTPPSVQEGEDYLVDHSIFFYLMDPEGKFVDCYPKDSTAIEVASSVKKYVEEYLANGGKITGPVKTIEEGTK